MRCSVLASVTLVLLTCARPSNAATLYTNDFEGAVGSEWSTNVTSVTPIGARRFLGEIGDETVSLTLSGVPSHDSVTISFELFVIRSWDGNDTGTAPPFFGPDVWTLTADGGLELLKTTFSNNDGSLQAFPDAFPGGSQLPRTGASEINTLGYLSGPPQDAVYSLSFAFPHNATELQLSFSASLEESVVPITGNESWGLDNVEVVISSIVPEPPAVVMWSLFACFFAGVILSRSTRD